MNYAIVLAGGTGTRLGGNIPKQYLEINGKAVIVYSLETFENHSGIDKIVVVAATEWQAYILEKIKEYNITKFIGFADAGKSRQHSVLNAMEYLYSNITQITKEDIVLFHDSARPNMSARLIDECLDLQGYDGTMPVISVPDTIYYSENGAQVDNILNRDKLYAGQAPEAFPLEKYYRINKTLTDEELSLVRGSSQIAFLKGLKIRLFAGENENYKITTAMDFEKFKNSRA